MAKQVVGLFDNLDDAHAAVEELTTAGFTSDDISIVANNASGGYSDSGSGDSEAAEGAGAGAVGGAVLGGLGGLLVGLGALAIPGVGPVVAAGTLATALGSTAVGAGLGAAAGGLVGALVGAGIPEDDANIYAEGIRRGGALVTVQATNDNDADRAADILDRHNVVDIDDRGTSYRNSGWNRFDENDTSYAGSSASGGTADSPRSEWAESSKVGTAGGGLAGAATGAAIGSVGGPVGTVIGGVAGAVTGAGVGAAGDAAGEAASDAATGEDDAGTRGYRSDRGSGTPMGSSTDYSTGSGAAIGSATDYGTDTGRAAGSTTGYSSTTNDTSSTGFQTGARDINADQGEMAIPVVEEEIRVGKREVESGGVRVNTRVEETPVNEQVTLRDERVTVERRPVDQAVDASTVGDAFREGTFEVRERDEEAVIQKEARIVEEIVVNKEVEQHTEQIQDTVRRTDVDVEQVPGNTRTSGYTEASDVRSSNLTGGTTGTGSDIRGTGTDEGAIEGGVSRGGNAIERGSGLDLDRDGDVGQRDRRDNF